MIKDMIDMCKTCLMRNLMIWEKIPSFFFYWLAFGLKKNLSNTAIKLSSAYENLNWQQDLIPTRNVSSECQRNG